MCHRKSPALTWARTTIIFNHRVKLNAQALDLTFAALGDPTRRAILTRLADGDASVGELAAPFSMSLPAISKHLRVLRRAGLVTQQRDGRVRRCQLTPGPLRDAAKWIEHYRRFWKSQFDALEQFLESTHPKEKDDD